MRHLINRPYHHKKRIIPIILIALCFISADPPDGYYDSADGLIESALQQALHDIIDNHSVLSYSSLWTHFQNTDKKVNGKVWDMYSDVPGGTPPYEFTFGTDQDNGTGGTAEGQKYNREHSWPRSWFNDQSPMNTDLFHVYPTDKYVNSRRGNYPYGEVGSPTWTSLNGSKLGSCSYPGYTGTVFEPIDDYKGDFARSYFYMSVRYYNEDNSWAGSPMADGSQMEDWALEMLLEWHESDPVSQKELDRNEAVYSIQNNRNPFIDHPYFVDNIWGDPVQVEQSFTPSDFELSPAYPNPFNPITTFDLTVPSTAGYSIEVFDIGGHSIDRLFNGTLNQGSYNFYWDGKTVAGAFASSGIYFIRVKSGQNLQSNKIALVR